MRQITKNKVPSELSAYKKKKDSIYDGPNFTPIKEKIRLSLLDEQGYLCAYCMNRIDVNSMKIEHWACQHSHPSKQLDYTNLLACCIGHEGFSPKEQTCDTRKGGHNIKFSPAIRSHRVNEIIKYDSQGTIISTDVDFNIHLNDNLNLNKMRMKLNRRTVLCQIQHTLSQRLGGRKSTEIQKLIDFYIHKNSIGQFSEYYGVIIYYLQKKL